MSRLRRGPALPLTLALMLFQLIPATVAQDTANQLSTRIREIIDGPNYRQAHWGILVVDSETGEVVFSVNVDRLFLPASVTKIFSVAAALTFLGADHRFETPVYRRGGMAGDMLNGDLILVAQGDVTLGGRTTADGKMAFKDQDHTYANGFPNAAVTDTDPLAGLKSLAKQVAASGIRQVTGEVLIDERLFDRSPSTGSGPTIVTPIVVNDNVVDILITPGAKEGEPATVKIRPDTNYVRMDAEVITAKEGAPVKIELKAGGNERFSVRGQIPLSSKPLVRIYPVEDPGAFARALFIDALRAEGIKVAASSVVPPRMDLPEWGKYDKANRVALFTSPPFSELVKVVLKVSHNLYASTLPLLLAVKEGKKTLGDGMRIQKRVLADLGVDVKTISFGGGAGGDKADQVTPRAAVQLLVALAKRADYKIFEDALPVLGVDGTLADVVAAVSAARGMVKAKTGTYLWFDALNERFLLTSKALAGTMVTGRGRRLTFAMFVNNVPLPRGVTSTREGRTLAQLCEVIHEHAR